MTDGYALKRHRPCRQDACGNAFTTLPVKGGIVVGPLEPKLGPCATAFTNDHRAAGDALQDTREAIWPSAHFNVDVARQKRGQPFEFGNVDRRVYFYPFAAALTST